MSETTWASDRPLRIAFLHPSRGPITPRDWSGTPYGLISAFEALGVDVAEVGYRVQPLVRRAAHVAARLSTHDLAAAERSPIKMALRRRSHQRQLDRLGPLDGIVAVGTDCYRLDGLRTDAPIATYDDATLATMWVHPDSDTSRAGFRPKDVERWIGIQRASSRRAFVCCVSTPWAARAIIGDYGIPPERVAVVGMGHRPRRAPGGTERDWATPTFLFVGVDWQRKNGAAVLRAFERVRRIHATAVLHVVGRHDPIEQAGVIDHGVLGREDAAAQETLDRLLEVATAFVLPSRFDPSPIAYLEAASAGLPVIATTEGGAGELLGDAAITVSPDDDDAIVRAMLELVDPAEAHRRGVLARAAVEHASWEQVAARILTGLTTRVHERVR